jgi:MFS transporter, ACS family, glucarate transporter
METSAKSLGQSAKPTRYRWFVAILFFVIYSIACCDRANVGVALPFLRKEFVMSNAEAGGLVSLFLIAYALGQLPSAWLLSKFGVRKVFPIAMIATSVMTGVTAFVGTIFQLKICRFLLGTAEAPLPIGVTTTINNWFPAKEKGTASGIFLAAVKFGPVITPPLGAAIIALWGWREIFIMFAVPGIILSVFWYFLVTNRPEESRFVNKGELDVISEQVKGQPGAQKIVVSRPIPWLDWLIRIRDEKILDTNKGIFRSWNIIGSSLGYCCQLGISNVLLAWIPTYLITVKKFSIMGMGFVAAAPFVGAVAGNLIGGLISDRLLDKRRKPGMMLSAISTAVMMYILISSPADPVVLGLLLLLTGFLFNIGFSAYMAYPMPFIAKDKFPVANAIVNMGGQLGGAAGPFIAGVLLDSLGWDYVFGFMASISILTFLLLTTISEPMKITESGK